MKRFPALIPLLLAAGLTAFLAGCANLQRPAPSASRPLTYALVVSVNGNEAPTDAQWAALQKKFSAMLAARGVALLIDPTFADRLIHVQFYPDADDPTTGSVYVVGVRTNTSGALAVATRSPVPATSYTYSGYGSASYYNYYPQYYGYFADYSYPYTDISTVPARSGGTPPKQGHPPGTHHTTKPIDCPPEPPSRPPGSYAGNNPPGDRGGWWRSHPQSDNSSSSSYNSSSSYSSGRVYDSPSYSSSSYSSSSNSSPVYSSPSPSSSYTSSSPSISMSSSSSYSAPSISMSSSSTSSSSSSSSSSSGGGASTTEQPR
ncbi:MAG: hypothetical protein HZA93_06805 [Verrucomicrobia bacterium]|nr:hypothetical protein [Verrucomicrobiota bacterium]